MKRIALVAVAAAAILALSAGPALAEGYNNPTGPGEYTKATGYFSGPHGGYTTTTNKCADCHSTHYASGKYKLLRADTREAACDYCHSGGGGSSMNIMMDNDYRSVEAAFGTDAYGAAAGSKYAAAATGGAGMGTGHTLGYTGMAPTDVQPAFSDSQGFACFDCHTPHGNSARVLQAFGSPSHAAGAGYITDMYGASFMTTQMYRIQEMFKVKFDTGMASGGAPSGMYYVMPEDFTKMPGTLIQHSNAPMLIEDMQDPPAVDAKMGAWAGAGYPKAPEGADMMAWYGSLGANRDADGYHPVSAAEMGSLMAMFPPTLMDLMSNWFIYWGNDVDGGNVATKFWNMGNWQYNEDGTFTVVGTYSPQDPAEVEVWHKPLFAEGRFLLLKNPDTGDDYTMAQGGVNDLGMPSPDMKTATAGQQANAANGKKLAVDWEWPLGPAASWGPFFYTGNNERFPLAFPWAPKGVAMQNEFCASCHDGTAGQSTQEALVYNSTESTYTVAFSHDSNPRGCARQQYLNPDDGNNFGPHCANCHTGASGCQTCHSETGMNWYTYGQAVYAPSTNGVFTNADDLTYEGRSAYRAPASMKSSAVAAINGQCMDGGFSYPHRTMGVNMLKDELWGVDFDGTPVAAGELRSSQGSAETTFGATFFSQSFEATKSIAGQAAENLDSVCIDCHGDASYYNGDNPDYYVNFASGNPMGNETWNIKGWEVLMKGLP